MRMTRPSSSGPPSPPRAARPARRRRPCSRPAEAIAAQDRGGGGFGAFEAGALVAAALWRVDGDALHVARVSVALTRRGRGIARALIAACEKEARARCRQAHDSQNAAGIARKRAPVRALRLCPAGGRGASGIRDADHGGDGEGPRMTGVTAPGSAPVRLKIDLGALADNWRELARRVGAGALRRRRQGQRLWDRPRRGRARAVGGGGAHFLRRPFQRRACGAPRPAGGGADLCAERPRERGRSGGLCGASPRARDRRRRGARSAGPPSPCGAARPSPRRCISTPA